MIPSTFVSAAETESLVCVYSLPVNWLVPIPFQRVSDKPKIAVRQLLFTFFFTKIQDLRDFNCSWIDQGQLE
jgi:hypothetical protein